ncbi:MAG: hypothetical protein RLZZ591_1948 [Pseudomonadota bacterium]|jgi:folate-binding protein YgfZ
MNFELNGVAELPQLGLLRAQGEDAAQFLHGQLTHDFALLGADQARLAGYCSPKGRLLASFVGFKRSPTDILLVVSRDVLSATLKRLSLFVMRAKVKLSDASADFHLRGISGSALVEMTAGDALAPWARRELDQANLVGLFPAQGVQRALWVAPADVPLPQGPAMNPDLWAWSEVCSGVATVTAPVAEAFVPQMLNYESVGGVSFKKGCYPGQEVVARSQFRGTLKRRAVLMHSALPMASGDEVFDLQDPEQSCGTVVQAAPAPTGGFDAIVSGQWEALQTKSIHLQSAQGPLLALMSLPYPLLDDI